MFTRLLACLLAFGVFVMVCGACTKTSGPTPTKDKVAQEVGLYVYEDIDFPTSNAPGVHVVRWIPTYFEHSQVHFFVDEVDFGAGEKGFENLKQALAQFPRGSEIVLFPYAYSFVNAPPGDLYPDATDFESIADIAAKNGLIIKHIGPPLPWETVDEILAEIIVTGEVTAKKDIDYGADITVRIDKVEKGSIKSATITYHVGPAKFGDTLKVGDKRRFCLRGGSENEGYTGKDYPIER
jgi:hypothetical protein